jgi:hypothetical protein
MSSFFSDYRPHKTSSIGYNFDRNTSNSSQSTHQNPPRPKSPQYKHYQEYLRDLSNIKAKRGNSTPVVSKDAAPMPVVVGNNGLNPSLRNRKPIKKNEELPDNIGHI